MWRHAVTAFLFAVFFVVAVTGDVYTAAIGIVAVGCVAAAMWAFRGGGWRRPLGVPTPPTVRHVNGCPSGVYKFELAEIDRHGRAGRSVGVKAGKSSNVDMRVSNYITLSDRRILDEKVVRTPDFHEVEARIHRDLAPWRLSGVRARELYKPCRQVRWYLDEFVRRSRT